MYIKILKNSMGIALIALGIAGIFLPIIPGILLLLGGFFLLGIKVEKVKKWWEKMRF